MVDIDRHQLTARRWILSRVTLDHVRERIRRHLPIIANRRSEECRQEEREVLSQGSLTSTRLSIAGDEKALSGLPCHCRYPPNGVNVRVWWGEQLHHVGTKAT